VNEVYLYNIIRQSIEEDVGTGDITAALIAKDVIADAEIISRESAIVCGIPWFNEVYYQIDDDVRIQWHVAEGDEIRPNQCLVTLGGCARSLVTGERCALNWLQLLSGTATQVARCVKMLSGTKTELLDTRKTIPGLRQAQKYAVKMGGGRNHRMGLYDAYLIKENHIASCCSIKRAIEHARQLFPDKSVEVEIEQLSQLQEALSAGADIIMLDNFNFEQMEQAVAITQGQAKLEVSGNVSIDNLSHIANTGIDYISMGALTKNVTAVDLSMRFISSLKV